MASSIVCRSSRAFPYVATKLVRWCAGNVNKLSLEVDALDDFTSQLMQRKTQKWEHKKQLAQKLVQETTNCNDIKQQTTPTVRHISNVQVNELFQQALDNEDYNLLLELMLQCIDCNKSPSLSIILQVLSTCSQKGDKLSIEKVVTFCQKVHPAWLQENSNFNHFLAEAIWIRGNIPESLNLFEQIYRENGFLRRRIRLILQNLFTNVISSRSEAALVNITKFSQTLVKDFQDFFPMTCLWQICFLSEWFTDQCLAIDLLEENEGLRKAVVNRIPYVVTVSLRSHRTEVVYRLLEVFLRYEMKQQYTRILIALLEYQFQLRDVRSCLEIVQWSIKHDVELPNVYHENLLQLLIKHNIQVPHKTKPDKRIPVFKF